MTGAALMTIVYRTVVALAVVMSAVEASVFISFEGVSVMALEALIFLSIALLATIDAIIASDALSDPMIKVLALLEA